MNTGWGNGMLRTVLSGALKIGSVEQQHSVQSWIADSNSVWPTNLRVRRYNRGAVRWPANWTSTSIQFDAVTTPLTFSDGQFAIVVDGVIQQTVTLTTSAAVQSVVVTGLTLAVGGSTVEVWEPWGANPSTQNTGADIQVDGGFVYAVWLPPGMAVQTSAVSTAIINIGDSISGYILPQTANHPTCYYGAGGQLRALSQAKGWGFASLDYGGANLLGDGLTAANYITWVNEMVAAMGNPATVKLLYLPCRNDWANYGGAGVSSTPTQCQTFLQAMVTGMPSFQHIICTNIPQLSEAPNGGGFTLGSYRTAEAGVTGATILDGTSFGINTGADLGDGVHMTLTGIAKFLRGATGGGSGTGVCPSVGL